ncbi:MAG: MFS transporter [Leptolyngbyaceae bacterium]|nr:MFS transporter [Leptolyngbyaceae bacterium]
MSTSKSQPSVLWGQVISLALLQGAITLTWVIYNLYLAQLLTDFGLPASLARWLLVVENALAIVLEPVMGGLSDQSRRWVGTRFLLISAGVIAASGLFIAIPAVVILGKPLAVMPWLLPGVMVAWAIAMTVFRSPALAMLGQYASQPNLPHAASILTLMGGLIGSVRPLASGFLLSLGPAVTFAVGSFTLLGTAAVLRKLNPPVSPTPDPEEQAIPLPVLIQPLGLIFAVGGCIAWGIRLTMGDLLTRVLPIELPGINLGLAMGVVSIALAGFAIPAGKLAVKLGNQRALLGGLGAIAVLVSLLVSIHQAIGVTGVAIALIACLSLINNGTIPFALSLVPGSKAGLAVGTYFGGFSAGMSLFGIVFAKPGVLALPIAAAIAAVAFLVAGLCIAASSKLPTVMPQEIPA